MECTYTGNFDVHHINKKRRLIGPEKEKAISSIVIKHLSSDTFREKEANRLMINGRMLFILLFSQKCTMFEKLLNCHFGLQK